MFSLKSITSLSFILLYACSNPNTLPTKSMIIDNIEKLDMITVALPITNHNNAIYYAYQHPLINERIISHNKTVLEQISFFQKHESHLKINYQWAATASRLSTDNKESNAWVVTISLEGMHPKFLCNISFFYNGELLDNKKNTCEYVTK